MSTVTLTQTRAAAAPSPAPAPSKAASSPSSTHILIDDQWYDLTHWKKHHPGGPLIIEQMDGNDATGKKHNITCNNDEAGRIHAQDIHDFAPHCSEESWFLF
jgi:cytochrome b involved in lipid metabolism